MTSPIEAAEVISRSQSHTSIPVTTSMLRERIATMVTTRGIKGVVEATDLVTAFSNAVAFAGPAKSDHHHLRLEVRDGTLIVVATDRVMLTKETLPLLEPEQGDNSEPYQVRAGHAVIGVRDAKYVIRLLGRRPVWPPVRVAFSAVDTQTTTSWAEPGAGSGGEEPELSHALTIEVVKGREPLRTELPAYGPVTPLPYEKYFTGHVPAPATTVLFNPQLLARFAQVAAAPRADLATSMTMSLAEPGKPVRVTIGDRFEAIVMPLRPPGGFAGLQEG